MQKSEKKVFSLCVFVHEFGLKNVNENNSRYSRFVLWHVSVTINCGIYCGMDVCVCAKHCACLSSCLRYALLQSELDEARCMNKTNLASFVSSFAPLPFTRCSVFQSMAFIVAYPIHWNETLLAVDNVADELFNWMERKNGKDILCVCACVRASEMKTLRKVF